jgi:hypothetical protein
MPGFQHKRRSLTVTLPRRALAAGWLAALLLLCLLALSSSASALTAGPASLPAPSPTSTAAAPSSRIGHVTSTVTGTPPTPSATQVASAPKAAAVEATASAGGAVEASRHALPASKAPAGVQVRATVERTASSVESKARSGAGVAATVERTASSIGSKAPSITQVRATVERTASSIGSTRPVKETVAVAAATIGHTVDGKVASGVTERSTLVPGATAETTALLAPASSAIPATTSTAKLGTSIAGRSASPARPASEQGNSAGIASGEQEGGAPHQESGAAAQADRLYAQGAPPTSSRAWPSTVPTPLRALSPKVPSASRSDAQHFQSLTASFPSARMGSYDNGPAAERGAANTIEGSASAAPEPAPSQSPGAIGYSGAAASAGASGLSIFLLIFSLLSIGGLMAMSLLRLASEPRRLAPIALIPERPG